MTCANVLVGLGKIVKGWRLAMLDGRMEVRLSASLPRRERLHHHQPVLREPCISIHAPAKGATACKRSLSLCAAAFQSTLPRRERHLQQVVNNLLNSNFNPRSREGSDVGRCNLERLTAISIHAPAKGATYFDYLKVSVRIFQSTLPRRERRASYETRTSGRCYFNPRSREGSDSSANSIINRQTLFQSTLPRRERHPAPLPSHPLQHFNPRSREGSDGLLLHSARTEQDFNPRSREGSDRLLGRGLRCGLSFQSTLPRRERQYNRIEAVTGFPFQSTLPRRERPCAATVPTSTPFNFNPRSREGSDHDRRRERQRHRYFNPRSREGSDLWTEKMVGNAVVFQSTLPRRERL